LCVAQLFEGGDVREGTQVVAFQLIPNESEVLEMKKQLWMIYSACVLVATGLFLTATAESDVTTLTSDTFYPQVKSGVWLVEFYAPWCPHCMALAPVWEKLATEQKTKGGFRVASVNCDEEADICAEMEITGFPSIYLFHGKDTSKSNVKRRATKYSGNREISDFVKFVETHKSTAQSNRAASTAAPSGPIVLNSRNWEAKTSEGDWLVEFYVPWCGHCQNLAPTWEKLAAQENPKGQFKVGQVECETEKSLCASLGVEAYPEIQLYLDGRSKGPFKFQGQRTVDAFVEFVRGTIEDQVEDPLIPIHKLTASNFDRKVLLHPATWLLEFYAPWCQHCQELAPTWEQLARNNVEYGLPIQLAKINCDEEEELCARFGVEAYPTIKMVQVVDYTGASRDVRSIENWVSRYDGSQVVPAHTDVITLDASTFAQTHNGIWLIDFYVPWCGHCKQLTGTWEEVATAQKGNFFTAKLNCEQSEAEMKLCQNLNIASYPTIILFIQGQHYIYSGPRTAQGFADFVWAVEADLERQDQGPGSPDEGDLIHLNERNFDENIADGRYWFVDFYASWCDHCKEMEQVWEDLALIENPDGKVYIASVNCVLYPDLCARVGVESYPTLRLYHKGKIAKKYRGDKTLAEFKKFLSANVKGYKTKTSSKRDEL
jgi:protein disulfide-isomerase-like protein